MPRVQLQIGRKTDQAQSPLDSVERLVNGYMESVPQGKETAPVYGTPGLNTLVNLVTGVGRGIHVMADRAFAVSGIGFYEAFADGTKAHIGDMDAGTLVSMADDGSNLVIVNPTTGKIWVYNGATLQVVTDPDAAPASSVCWIDGYFVFSQKDTNFFFISDLGNPFSFNGLNYAAAEWRPGNLYGVIILEKSVFMLKEHSIEAWYDTGDTTSFVFGPRPDVHIPVGVAGVATAVSTNQTIYFLADDLTVRRLDGLVPTRISTFAIERLIRGAPEIGITGWQFPENTIVTSHIWRGHLFVVFNNPDGCVVFDQATQQWHERQSYGRASWAGCSYAYAFGQHLFQDVGSPAVRILQSNAYNDEGSPIVFEVTFPFVYQGGAPFIVKALALIMDTGRIATLNKTAKVEVSYTDDGYRWSSWRERSIGATGDYGRLVTITMGGRTRGRAYRIRITDLVARNLLSAYADLELLAA